MVNFPREFDYWCDVNNVDKRFYKYAGGAGSIAGLIARDVIKIGSYYELKNLKVIEDFCNSRVREIV